MTSLAECRKMIKKKKKKELGKKYRTKGKGFKVVIEELNETRNFCKI